MVIRILPVLLLNLVVSVGFAQPDSLRIAFYNCENFFDSFRDSTINDADFTPDGPRRWTYTRFLSKRNNIYKVFASMSNPVPPEIIGLCEVENRFVLNKLAYETPLSKFEYAVVHANSTDKRGIDVGLIYQKNKLHLLKQRHFDPNKLDSSLFTRSILYAVFRWGELDTLHVLVNHFPSKLGGNRANKHRVLVMRLLQSKIDSLLRMQKFINIIVLGDFNDTPESELFNTLSPGMVNLALPLQKEKRGTLKYDGEWELIDQIWVSRSLIGGATPVKLIGEMEIYSAPFLLEEDEVYGGMKPRRTYIGYRYNGGFSDHLPVFAKFLRVL